MDRSLDPEPSYEELQALLSPFSKVAGALLALLMALAGAWAASKLQSFGYAFLFALPFSVGFVVGYYGFTGGIATYLTVAVVVISAGMGVVSGNIAGFFCTLVTACIVITPAIAGSAAGSSWRAHHIRTRGEALGYRFFAALIVAIPAALWAEATLTPRHPLETVATSRIVPMEALDAWSAAAFYEDVPLDRPLLLRLALPRPIGTQGAQFVEGGLVDCLYEGARITKRMTRVVPGEQLAFDIVHQSGIEDRSASLQRGSFGFEYLGDGRTRVTLRSTYEPLLDARLAWRPIERLVCRTMHGFLLDGLRCPPAHHSRANHRLTQNARAARTVTSIRSPSPTPGTSMETGENVMWAGTAD
ncbi:MAG: hypothetical protein AAGG01_03090 [Planctomycetota bacterium]